MMSWVNLQADAQCFRASGGVFAQLFVRLPYVYGKWTTDYLPNGMVRIRQVGWQEFVERAVSTTGPQAYRRTDRVAVGPVALLG